MTKKDDEKMKEFIQLLLEKTGKQFLLTDPVLPYLFIQHSFNTSQIDSVQNLQNSISRKIDENVQSLKILTEQLRKLTEQIDTKTYNYHFNAPGEAWKFTAGNSLKWHIVCVSILSLVFIGKHTYEKEKHYKAAQIIYQNASTIEQALLQKIQVNENGFYYLDFKKAKNNAGASFYHEYEPMKKDVVRVYLGQASDK